MWTLRELFAEAILVVTALYNPQSDEIPQLDQIKTKLNSTPKGIDLLMRLQRVRVVPRGSNKSIIVFLLNPSRRSRL